jgi:hypothetical protein
MNVVDVYINAENATKRNTCAVVWLSTANSKKKNS